MFSLSIPIRLDRNISSRSYRIPLSAFIFRGREEEGGGVVRQSRFSIGWKPELEIEECSIDVGWKLAPLCGWCWPTRGEGSFGGRGKRRWGVRITRFLMTNDDVSRGRFVDRRGIGRVSWYWTICFFFFFFEEEGEELYERRLNKNMMVNRCRFRAIINIGSRKEGRKICILYFQYV